MTENGHGTQVREFPGEWNVVDLFSGSGGASYGFSARDGFRLVGAADAQKGKPSSGVGSLQCNATYAANIGVEPVEADLSETEPVELRESFGEILGVADPDVLISCAPCTGFTRTNPDNHLVDDPRNSLAARSALFAAEFRPRIFIMENVREMISGRFRAHYADLRSDLEALGYRVRGEVRTLDKYGLPQQRERALMVAARDDIEPRCLDDLWRGWRVRSEATTVRSAIGDLPRLEAGERHSEDPMHVSPNFADARTADRMLLIPRDGGSWTDLRNHPDREEVLIPSMLRAIERGRLGDHPDVYGRMWWDRPAPTIKRECAHVGNGRYSHPEQNRMLTVREMATLQGFPRGYVFRASGLANMYRHIGDAVPPLISYQLAALCEWMLTGERPDLESLLLPGTHLTVQDLEPALEVEQPHLV